MSPRLPALPRTICIGQPAESSPVVRLLADRAKHIGGAIAGSAGGADAMEFLTAIKTVQATRQASTGFSQRVASTLSSHKSWIDSVLSSTSEPHSSDFSR